jgi:uncharacterized membrane protein YozB (DUF420 family)
MNLISEATRGTRFLFGLSVDLMMFPGLNMLAQLVITGVLFAAVLYAKRREFRLHGLVVASAVALNGLSILLVMVPSALRIFSGAGLNSFTLTVGVHVFLGTVAQVAGLYIVWTWRLRDPGGTCFRLGGRMRSLSWLWTLMVALGALVYYMLYF